MKRGVEENTTYLLGILILAVVVFSNIGLTGEFSMGGSKYYSKSSSGSSPFGSYGGSSSGSSASLPKLLKTICADTDLFYQPGGPLFTKGVVIYSEYYENNPQPKVTQFVDECLTAPGYENQIKEGYCKNAAGQIIDGGAVKPTYAGKETYSITPIKCPANTVCLNGACVNKPQPQKLYSYVYTAVCGPYKGGDGEGVTVTSIRRVLDGDKEVTSNQMGAPDKVLNICTQGAPSFEGRVTCRSDKDDAAKYLGADTTNIAELNQFIAISKKRITDTKTNPCPGACAPNYGCIAVTQPPPQADQTQPTS